jgi:hypothetical protein
MSGIEITIDNSIREVLEEFLGAYSGIADNPKLLT